MTEIQKSQSVRLIDVWFLGPFLVWAAMQPRMTRATRTILAVSGAATIVYNGRNYLANRSASNDG